jgi:hypothetical protein
MNDGNCNIRLELDHKGRPEFATDDTMSGTVIIEVSEDVTCNHLDVELSWHVRGRGTDHRSTPVTVHLFSGNWVAGQTYTYDFQLDLPGGPCSYDGAYFDLDWEIAATADIPWSIDPSDATPLALEPGATATNPSVGQMTAAEYLDAQPPPESSFKLGFTAFGALCLVVGLILLAPYFFGDATWIPLLIGLPVTGIAAWMLYTGLKDYLVERQLGEVDIALSSAWLSPGGSLTCTVQIEPETEVDLNDVNLKLTAIEATSRGHEEHIEDEVLNIDHGEFGEHAEAFRGAIYEKQVSVDRANNATLHANSPSSFSETIPLEETAPCTLTAGRNEITWHLEATIDIPGWPDWTHARRLLVAPGAKQLPETLRIGPASADLIATEQSNQATDASPEQPTDTADVRW